MTQSPFNRPLARFHEGRLQCDDGGIWRDTDTDHLRFKRAMMANVPWAATDIDVALAQYADAQKEKA